MKKIMFFPKTPLSLFLCFVLLLSGFCFPAVADADRSAEDVPFDERPAVEERTAPEEIEYQDSIEVLPAASVYGEPGEQEWVYSILQKDVYQNEGFCLFNRLISFVDPRSITPLYRLQLEDYGNTGVLALETVGYYSADVYTYGEYDFTILFSISDDRLGWMRMDREACPIGYESYAKQIQEVLSLETPPEKEQVRLVMLKSYGLFDLGVGYYVDLPGKDAYVAISLGTLPLFDWQQVDTSPRPCLATSFFFDEEFRDLAVFHAEKSGEARAMTLEWEKAHPGEYLYGILCPEGAFDFFSCKTVSGIKKP